MKYVLCLIATACWMSLAAMAGDIEQGVEAMEKKNVDLAITCFSKAIEASPKAPVGYFFRGLAYREKKEYDKAIADFTSAIRYEPEPSPCYYNRACIYTLKRDFKNAQKDFDESIRLTPKNPIPYVGRGFMYEESKEYQRAAADYTRAIELDPMMPVACNNLAWLKSTCPDAKFRDGKQAIQLAATACQLTEWKAWFELNTLAAAHAEVGEFKEAVRWQKKAIELGNDDKELVEKAQQRLKLYEKGEPYRQ